MKSNNFPEASVLNEAIIASVKKKLTQGLKIFRKKNLVRRIKNKRLLTNRLNCLQHEMNFLLVWEKCCSDSWPCKLLNVIFIELAFHTAFSSIFRETLQDPVWDSVLLFIVLCFMASCSVGGLTLGFKTYDQDSSDFNFSESLEVYFILNVEGKVFMTKTFKHLICGNKMPTRCNRWFLLQILLLAQHVSGKQ